MCVLFMMRPIMCSILDIITVSDNVLTTLKFNQGALCTSSQPFLQMHIVSALHVKDYFAALENPPKPDTINL